jgi:hypothetical protein
MNENYSNKQVVTKVVKNDLETKNWKHLSAIMPVADKYKIARSLRLKGWKHLAGYYYENEKHIDAIVAFNKARQVALGDEQAIRGLFNSLIAVYNEQRENFSREDLVLLENQIDRLISFYTIHLPIEKAVIEDAEKLHTRIKVHLHSASSKEETPATHRVEYIYNALYGDMTIEEIRAEFARIMAPYFREKLEEDAINKKKKKRGSKK